MPAAALPGSTLSRLSDLLARRMGLHFPKKRWDDLERGVAAVASAFGASDKLACAEKLLSAPLTRREIEILAGQLTVGETYFFREKSTLETFERYILPELLVKRRPGSRSLRLWSAGCCTGEEPYTIAMLLDRLVPGAPEWKVTLLATDINPDFIDKAVRGEYSEWSFRATPDWIRRRYFRQKGAGRFQIQQRIRERVRFSCLNLADDHYPSHSSNTNGMDVIFCRNVLMYFTREQARTVVHNLHRSLVDGGWLVVSAAETSDSLFSRFTPVHMNGVTLYRKCAEQQGGDRVDPLSAPAADKDAIWMAIAHEPAPAPCSQEGSAAISSAVTAERADNPPAPGNTVSPGQAARDLANQGRLDEAAEQCQAAIGEEKLNPLLHYLLATIQQELGKPEAAVEAYARALYLDPDFVLAHFALGNLYRVQGKHHAARRQYDNALGLLRKLPEGQVLPESDGLTAGRLDEIIQSIRLSPVRADGS